MFHNIPKGSELIGTKYNNPVWRIPDRRELMVVPSLEINPDFISNKESQIVELGRDVELDSQIPPYILAFKEAVKERKSIPVDSGVAVLGNNGKIEIVSSRDAEADMTALEEEKEGQNQDSKQSWWVIDEEAARKIGNEILEDETKERFPNLPDHNNKADAWRHARWNERMVNEINWLTATLAGYKHELDNLEKKYGDWKEGDNVNWGNVVDEMLMDLHNNRAGRSGKSADELLQKGRLRTIEPPYRGKGGLY